MAETVFISYSSTYAAQVNQIKQWLTQHGITVWIDHERLTPGTEDWGKAIERGIQSSKALIYIASPEARASKYVGHELDLAEKKYRLPICPTGLRAMTGWM